MNCVMLDTCIYIYTYVFKTCPILLHSTSIILQYAGTEFFCDMSSLINLINAFVWSQKYIDNVNMLNI